MSQALVHVVVESEHRAHRLLDGGDLIGRRITAARDQQHQDRRGVTRIVDGPQRRSLLRFARLGAPRLILALRRPLAKMVDAAHADEPINHPKHQSAGNQDDDRHSVPPRCSTLSGTKIASGKLALDYFWLGSGANCSDRDVGQKTQPTWNCHTWCDAAIACIFRLGLFRDDLCPARNRRSTFFYDTLRPNRLVSPRRSLP